MMASRFPQGTMTKESYLTLVLASLVRQAGGELRIGPEALEAVDGNINVLIDWDVKSQQLVIRTASAGLFISSVKGNAWTTTQPQNVQSLPLGVQSSPQNVIPLSQPPENDTSRHRIMTEEQILQVLESRMRKDMMRQWREQGTTVMEGMPPPNGRYRE